MPRKADRSAHLVATVRFAEAFTLRDLCECTGLAATEIIDMVEAGVLDAEGRVPLKWRFPAHSAQRIVKALRLRRDLGVNLAGAALVLDLLDELRGARAELERLRALLPR